MFKCQLCQTVVPAGVTSEKIVVRTRSREYRPRNESAGQGRWGRGRATGGKKKQYDKGGNGAEIAQEVQVCPTCANKSRQD